MHQFGFPLINLLRGDMCALVSVDKIILTGLCRNLVREALLA